MYLSESVFADAGSVAVHCPCRGVATLCNVRIMCCYIVFCLIIILLLCYFDNNFYCNVNSNFTFYLKNGHRVHTRRVQ
jgi:hypothetical protein